MEFSSIQVIIEAMRAGEMVIMVDDESRENEGDLIISASMITEKAVNFMISYAKGLLCLPLHIDRCKVLNLKPMTRHNEDAFGTNFMISIDAKEHISTGISVKDRTYTIHLASQLETDESQFVSPGHIFPLCAKENGVLERAGHTEAAVDLDLLAGFNGSAAIIEILNEDGTMARGQQLFDFAQKHHLKIATIKDLIEYRKNLAKTS